MRMRAVILFSLAGLGLVGCGSDPATSTDGAGETTTTPGGPDLATAAFVDLTSEPRPRVDALDNVFKAKFIQVGVGTEITFRNDGRNAHNLLPVVKGAFTPIEAADFEPGSTVTVAFGQPGDYAYYCSLHGTTTKGMVGAVRVMGQP